MHGKDINIKTITIKLLLTIAVQGVEIIPALEGAVQLDAQIVLISSAVLGGVLDQTC